MLKIIIAAVIALLIGGALGYQAARMKFIPMLVAKDLQVAGLVNSAKQNAMEEDDSMMMEKTSYILKDGELYRVNGATLTLATTDVVLDDGSTVTLKGVWIKPDKTRVQLKEGQTIWSDGTMMEKDDAMEEDDSMMMEKTTTTPASTNAPTSAPTQPVQ